MRQENQIPDGAFVVTWTGHFEFNKGIYYLKKIIDECADNKNIWFVVRSSVKKEDIPDRYKWVLNTPNVKFLTHGLDMSEFYNMGDMHLMTSTYDPMPLTVLEAMSCEKMVVAPKSGGHSEVIQHNASGFLVDSYFDTYQMAGWIKLMEKNRKWCQRLGKNARKRVLDKFTYAHMTDNYINAYSYFKIHG